ncbi:MAG: hypothetical protein LBR50_04145 [Tannerella sp.]|jgi:hypothetical protein|nr:hypothetical protein [Tannerella sp.]
MSNINRKIYDAVRQASKTVRMPEAVPVIVCERSGERESAQLSTKALEEARKSMPASVRNLIDARAAHQAAIRAYYDVGGSPQVDERELSAAQLRAWKLVEKAKMLITDAELQMYIEQRENPRIKV